jgi:two-component system NtrC family sensor kinase
MLREHWSVLGEAFAKAELREVSGDLIGEVEELIDESLEGVDRATAIVRDVKEFSHAGSNELELTDVNQVLEQTLRVAKLQIPKQARVETQLGDLPLISCWPQRIRQALMNLILNAAQAIRSDGSIRLVTEHVGSEVRIRIEDDGCGIPDRLTHRIFDPFFTTKPVGVGTGLGLAITFGIVKQHGGRIDVDSKPEQGTSIVVHLPEATDPEEASA